MQSTLVSSSTPAAAPRHWFPRSRGPSSPSRFHGLASPCTTGGHSTTSQKKRAALLGSGYHHHLHHPIRCSYLFFFPYLCAAVFPCSLSFMSFMRYGSSPRSFSQQSLRRTACSASWVADPLRRQCQRRPMHTRDVDMLASSAQRGRRRASVPSSNSQAVTTCTNHTTEKIMNHHYHRHASEEHHGMSATDTEVHTVGPPEGSQQGTATTRDRTTTAWEAFIQHLVQPPTILPTVPSPRDTSSSSSRNPAADPQAMFMVNPSIAGLSSSSLSTVQPHTSNSNPVSSESQSDDMSAVSSSAGLCGPSTSFSSSAPAREWKWAEEAGGQEGNARMDPLFEGPFFCTSLRECHVTASALWQRHVLMTMRTTSARGGCVQPHHKAVTPAVALEHLERILQWWEAVSAMIFVPRDVQAIEDVELFLSDVLHWPPSAASTEANMGEETQRLLEDLEEWLLMHDPPSTTTATMPHLVQSTAALPHSGTGLVLPATAGQAPNAPDHNERSTPAGDAQRRGKTTIHPSESIPYTRLLGLLHSYVRYHQGVTWGVQQQPPRSPGGVLTMTAKDKAAFYRRRYHLHPWDNVYCPQGGEQQRPYVDVLQWMLLSREKLGAAASSCLPHSIRGFREPFQFPSDLGFSALDVCSQSGFGVDLLLKAGANHVIAADASLMATANTEATYHEHIKQKRSGGAAKRLTTMRADVLPEPSLAPDLPLSSPLLSQQQQRCIPSTRRSESAESVFEAAAARRRRAAQQLGQKLGAALPSPSREQDGKGEQGKTVTTTTTTIMWDDGHGHDGEGGWTSPVSVLWYHPPVPAGPLPFLIHPLQPLPRGAFEHTGSGSRTCTATGRITTSRWWRGVLAEQRMVFGRQKDEQRRRSPNRRTAVNELVDTPPAEKNHRNDDKDDSGLTSRSPSSSPLDDAPGVEGDVLPWLPVPAPSAHPHHSRRVLQQFLTDLRRAPSPFSSSSSALPAPPPPPHERQTAERKKNGGKEKMPPKPVRAAVVPRQRVPILQQSGYLICLLPRTYHPLDEMLCTLRRRGRVRRGPLASPGSFEESLDEVVDAVEGALSDMVVQAFASPFPHDGAAQWYDLIQLKRYPLSLQSSVSGPTTIPPLPPRAKEMGRGLAGESSPIQLSPQDIGWAYLSASVMRAMGDGNDGMMMMMGAHHHHHHKNNHNHADQQKVVWERCHQLFSQWRASIPLQWVDLLVFKKKAATATTGGDSTSLHPSMRRGTGTGTAVAGSAGPPPPYVAPVQWEDSLEYDEYLPAEFPTQHHWIDAVPTYSYLEDDFIPPGRRQRPLITGGDLLPQPPHRLSSVSHLPEANVLAHGPLTVEKIRRVTVSSSPSSRLEKQNEIDGDRGSEDQEDDDAVPVSAWKADADAASAMFHTIFREELRKKRSHKKFRHMALSSSRDQQEWYIDEKLIKSEAAKVELMNQLARFDFQQNFDH